MNRNYLKDFVRLFFPFYCYGCRGPMITFEDMLCSYCLRQMPWKFPHQPVKNENRLVIGPPVAHTFSLLNFNKGGIVQHLLHELKYNNHPEIGLRLGRMLGMNLAEKGFNHQFDLIIPVPLHPSRRRVRGFNQSTVFAEGIGEMIGSEIDEKVALRKNATATQTKKDRQLRWSNVQNVFHITDPERLEGKKVLLADDVITTGATIAAFGKEVFKSKPASISIATIADVS